MDKYIQPNKDIKQFGYNQNNSDLINKLVYLHQLQIANNKYKTVCGFGLDDIYKDLSSTINYQLHLISSDYQPTVKFNKPFGIVHLSGIDVTTDGRMSIVARIVQLSTNKGVYSIDSIKCIGIYAKSTFSFGHKSVWVTVKTGGLTLSDNFVDKTKVHHGLNRSTAIRSELHKIGITLW